MSRRRRRLASTAAAAVLAASVGVAAAGGGDPDAADAEVTVEITAHHSRFTPSSVSVPAGATVRFVVRNLDPIDHELIVGGPEVHARHEAGRERLHHGDVPGEISAPAGTTASTTWRAPAGARAGGTAPAAGGTSFACHLPGHLAYGMAGVVVVTPRT